MLPPNEVEIKAVLNLKGHPSFEIIISWIERSLKEMALKGMKIDNETKLRWMQGRVLELSEQFYYFKNPQEFSAQIANLKEGRNTLREM